MSIALIARKWFISRYNNGGDKIYASKYYTPDQSWSQTTVWWLKVPMPAIDSKVHDDVHLLCEASPGEENFYYLKVPTAFFNEHIDKFHRTNGSLSLYL